MIEIRRPDSELARILVPVTPRPGITYIPSQFALSFEHKGKNYVFHTLTKQCVESRVPSSAAAGQGYDELIAGQFLVPSDKDECAYYNQISALLRAYYRKKGISTYTIMPTLGCNARCVYCYEEGMKPVSMTPETVEQVIRFILDTHKGESVKLVWFGGEPLLGVKAIDRICQGLGEAGLAYKSSMASNGSLITGEIVEKMTGDWKMDHVQISMDGAEQDYISRKQYFAYSDYYHRAMEAVSAMSEAGISVAVRCNVDDKNWEGVPRFLADLKAGTANKDSVSLYFSPLYGMRRGENSLAQWEKIRAARPLIEEAGFKDLTFAGTHLRFHVNHCMADGGGLVIAPDGSLYLCEHCPEGSRFGDIWQGTTDEAAGKEFCRTDRIREKCRTCPFLPDCTGFASCPVQDIHCRQMRERMAADTLKRLVEEAEKGDAEREAPEC